MTKAYLLGALHDGAERKKTYRIVSKNKDYVNFLKAGIEQIGSKAWIYREGKTRNLYVVKFSKSILKNFFIVNKNQKIDYIRSYFDSDGSVTKSSHVRYYIYFAQKNFSDLTQLRSYLCELDIECGVIHNPSKSADPNYWRFYIKKKSYIQFSIIIGSWHPVKRHLLRMKI